MWQWIVTSLDDDSIERDLNPIAQRKAGELQPKHARLTQVEKLTESIDGKIKRLVRDLRDLEFEAIVQEDDAGRWLDVS